MDNAVVLAEGVFGTTYGKTANGLVRYTKRFRVVAVIDSTKAGSDAGTVLAGKEKGIPIVSTVEEGIQLGARTLVVGVATDGGYIPDEYRKFISDAIIKGLNIVSGLHEFISDDPEFSALAAKHGSYITDVRKLFRDIKPPYTGQIKEVMALKIAVLGTDSAIGKRTTAVNLNNALKEKGVPTAMVGTGQTAWMQGFKHTVVVDSMINDFIPGGLESMTVEAWREENPKVIFIEGQGSVLHPAYPGSFEIIGACRPEAIILQHAPKRKFFDGFPDIPIPDLQKYIDILELLSGHKVIAISLNREGMTEGEVRNEIKELESRFGIPVFDPLNLNVEAIMSIIGH
ncbi:MAG: DUF1611 domain-containing protein [Candidatus Thermoplasmatota archaeon]|nr:DUF1611 domain-containing protein [Candidatus Thermoplasmatota archaeon]MCL5954744.1 DUF1611 domain-containing protein [Candidatus Thermoplasmatota archaeon]